MATSEVRGRDPAAGGIPWPLIMVILLLLGAGGYFALPHIQEALYEQQNAQATPYDLSRLHPDVRTAVEAARAAQTQADEAAVKARAVVPKAEDAAARAKAKKPGTQVVVWDGGNSYSGEMVKGVREGVGIFDFKEGDVEGDRYAGEVHAGLKHGAGVFTYQDNPNNTIKAKSYEGGYAKDLPDGMGIFTWRDGRAYSGGWKENYASGAGVFKYNDGRRFEGQYSMDKRNGYGVEWSAEGRVTQAGLWENGALVKPLHN